MIPNTSAAMDNLGDPGLVSLSREKIAEPVALHQGLPLLNNVKYDVWIKIMKLIENSTI